VFSSACSGVIFRGLRGAAGLRAGGGVADFAWRLAGRDGAVARFCTVDAADFFAVAFACVGAPRLVAATFLFAAVVVEADLPGAVALRTAGFAGLTLRFGDFAALLVVRVDVVWIVFAARFAAAFALTGVDGFVVLTDFAALDLVAVGFAVAFFGAFALVTDARGFAGADAPRAVAERAIARLRAAVGRVVAMV
jgi:hypothetical protein